jgi:hypothetical protein
VSNTRAPDFWFFDGTRRWIGSVHRNAVSGGENVTFDPAVVPSRAGRGARSGERAVRDAVGVLRRVHVWRISTNCCSVSPPTLVATSSITAM